MIMDPKTLGDEVENILLHSSDAVLFQRAVCFVQIDTTCMSSLPRGDKESFACPTG